MCSVIRPDPFCPPVGFEGLVGLIIYNIRNLCNIERVNKVVPIPPVTFYAKPRVVPKGLPADAGDNLQVLSVLTLPVRPDAVLKEYRAAR